MLRLGLGMSRRAAGGVVAPPSGSPSPPAMVQVHHLHEQFPNPSFDYDNYAVRSGNWSAASTWADGVPTAEQRVVIDSHTVRQDVVDAQVGSLFLMGTGKLYHDYTKDTVLTFDNLIGYDSAEWHAHGPSESDPIPANIVCRMIRRDTPLPDPEDDPEQHTGGVIFPKTTKVILRGAFKTTSAADLRLLVEPLAGHTTLTFVTAVVGWRAGDIVVVPPTDHVPYDDTFSDSWSLNYLFDERQIVSVVGTVVTLDSPLSHNHLGAADPKGVQPKWMPHAMNITRNVRVESENPAGTRGHCMYAERCSANLYYVGFNDLGRTHGSTLNNAAFDGDHVLTHYGTNQKGRYAVHRHHNFGPENLTKDMARFQGETVGCAVVRSRKWPIATHGTSYTRIAENNVYDGEHALISLEDGNEAYNRIENNMTFGVHAPDITDTWPVANHGWTPQPAYNRVIGNVMAGGRNSAYLPHGWHTDCLGRGGFLGSMNVDGVTQSFPLYPGADVMHGTEGVEYVKIYKFYTEYLEFRDNEFYALCKGISYDHYTGYVGQVQNHGVVRAWRLGVETFFVYGQFYMDITVDGLLVRDNYSRGYTLNSIEQCTITLKNSDIRMTGTHEGELAGISLERGGGRASRFVIEDSYLFGPRPIQDNFFGSAGVDAPITEVACFTTVRNVVTENPAGQMVPVSIKLEPHFNGQTTLIPACRYQIEVRDHQGVEGNDFRLYFKEQLSSAILPFQDDLEAAAGDSDFAAYGGLLDGGTNAENLADSGRCYGDEIIPAGAAGPDPAGYPGAYLFPIGEPVEVVSLTINEDGDELTVEYDQDDVYGHAGFTLTPGDNRPPLTLTYLRGDRSNAHTFGIVGITVYADEPMTVDYAGTDVKYLRVTPLAAFAGMEVTNNSTVPAPPPVVPTPGVGGGGFSGMAFSGGGYST